jgi:hypothetical protein
MKRSRHVYRKDGCHELFDVCHCHTRQMPCAETTFAMYYFVHSLSGSVLKWSIILVQSVVLVAARYIAELISGVHHTYMAAIINGYSVRSP